MKPSKRWLESPERAKQIDGFKRGRDFERQRARDRAIEGETEEVVDEYAMEQELEDAHVLQDAIDEGGPLLSPEETRRELGLEP